MANGSMGKKQQETDTDILYVATAAKLGAPS
jgi:hypothetical protein